MEKNDAVLIMLNSDALEEALKKLNLNKVSLAHIVMDGYSAKTFNVAGTEIPVVAFAKIHELLWKCRGMLWLICDSVNRSDAIRKMKKFLTALRYIPEGNIINFELTPKISTTLPANLRYVEEHGADYFVTGNEYVQVGLNLKFIPRVHADEKIYGGGVYFPTTIRRCSRAIKSPNMSLRTPHPAR